MIGSESKLLIEQMHKAKRMGFFPDWAKRTRAAELLGEHRASEAVIPLRSVVESAENQMLIEAAIKALGQIATYESAVVLDELSRASGIAQYRHALNSALNALLDELARNPREDALQKLLGLRRNLSSRWRPEISSALAKWTAILVQQQEICIPDPLLAQWNELSPEVKSHIIGKPALLIREYADGTKNKQVLISNVICEMGADVVPALVDLLPEDGTPPKSEIVELLAAIGEPAIAPLLDRSEENLAVQRILADLAKTVESVAQTWTEAELPLLETLGAMDSLDLRYTAVVTMGRVGGDAIPLLVDRLLDGRDDEGEILQEVLRSISLEVVTSLISRLAESQPRERSRIVDLLLTMEEPLIDKLRSTLETWQADPELCHVLWVPLDGDNEVCNLIQIVQEAAPHSMLCLTPGTYRLSAPLEVTKPLILWGESRESTRIESRDSKSLMRILADGDLCSRGISFGLIGSDWASVLEVDSGNIVLVECTCQGSVFTKPDGTKFESENPGVRSNIFEATQHVNPYGFALAAGKRPGSGLRMTGKATAWLYKCDLFHNAADGVAVEDDGVLEMFQSTCSQNGLNGVYVAGNAQAMLCESVIAENEERGIVSLDQATTELIENLSRGNGQIGIGFFGDSTGVVCKNRCHGEWRSMHGIYVGDQATAELEENTCTSHKLMGIAFYANGTGRATSNQCRENVLGVGVAESASPILIDNVCKGNSNAGIGFGDDAHGICQGNLCHKNEFGIHISGQSAPKVEQNRCAENNAVGLIVSDQAHPSLTANECTQNGQVGIVYVGNAGGVAEQNICSKNGTGIQVSDLATPMLRNNTCRSNRYSGLTYLDTSAGAAIANICTGNSVGLIVEDTAYPTLRDNDCHDNLEHNKQLGIKLVR